MTRVHSTKKKTCFNLSKSNLSATLIKKEYDDDSSYLLNIPELSNVLLYSVIIGELFTNSHILAEFFNQSRSETFLVKEGQFMDKTCK